LADNVSAEFPAGITALFPYGGEEDPMYVEATAVIMPSYLDAFVARGNSSRRANTSLLRSLIAGFFERSV
jgi:hypothetical protein